MNFLGFHSSVLDCSGLLGCATALLGAWFLMFCRNVILWTIGNLSTDAV